MQPRKVTKSRTPNLNPHDSDEEDSGEELSEHSDGENDVEDEDAEEKYDDIDTMINGYLSLRINLTLSRLGKYVESSKCTC